MLAVTLFCLSWFCHCLWRTILNFRLFFFFLILALSWTLGYWLALGAHSIVRQTWMITNSVWQQAQQRSERQRQRWLSKSSLLPFTLSRLAFSCLLGFLARMSLSFRILAISLSNTSSSSSSLRKLSKHRIDCHIWLQMMSGLGGGACSYKEAQRNMEGAGNPFPPENSPQSALQQLKPLLCPSPCLLYSWQCLYDLGKSVFLWFQRLRCVGKCV